MATNHDYKLLNGHLNGMIQLPLVVVMVCNGQNNILSALKFTMCICTLHGIFQTCNLFSILMPKNPNLFSNTETKDFHTNAHLSIRPNYHFRPSLCFPVFDLFMQPSPIFNFFLSRFCIFANTPLSE